MQIPSNRAEKRCRQRYPVRLSAILRYEYESGKRELHVSTENVNSRGVYFRLCPMAAAGLDEKCAVELVMMLPAMPRHASPRVRCRGRVLRIEAASAGMGVAVILHRYEFLCRRAAPTAPLSETCLA
jgi:hypothetical protein